MEIPQFIKSFKRYTFIGLCVGGILAIEFIFMITTWIPSSEAINLTLAPFTNFSGKTNTQALGNLLYTHYALVFQGAGIILLIAMIGAIILTLRHREGVKKQALKVQLGRQARESVSLVDIPIRSGG